MKKLLPFILLVVLVFVTGCQEEPPPELKFVETDAVWSPDGNTIAFYRSGGIWLIDADGTNERFFSADMQVDWSPDGERLVIATFGWNIYLIDKDSSNFEWLIQDGESNSPTWSPDGKWVAFTRPYAAGSIANVETFEEIHIPGGGGYSWSADSKELAYMYLPGTCFIKAVTLEDLSVREIFRIEPDEYGALTPPPHWSSDGKKILFMMYFDTWVVDISGENLECLAEYAVYPNWSPDGEQIVFTKCDEDGKLWVMDVDGKNQRPLREE